MDWNQGSHLCEEGRKKSLEKVRRCTFDGKAQVEPGNKGALDKGCPRSKTAISTPAWTN